MIDLTNVQPAIDKIKRIETELNIELIERTESVRAVMISLLTGQHTHFLGPPGTGKSRLITKLGARISTNGQNGQGLKTFVRLVTKTTQPEELFGPVSIQGLKNDEFRRVTANMLPEADLAFLDEIYNGASAILNTLLTIMNEREFDNGSQRLPVPLISLFSASNLLPQGEDLNALWDRQVLRVIVDYTSESGFARLLRTATAPAQKTTLTKPELVALQQATSQITIPASAYSAIEQLRRDLLRKGIRVSDRRWIWSMSLLQAEALLNGRNTVEEDDLMILKEALWTTPEQRSDIGRMTARLANPLNAKAVEISDRIESVFKAFEEALTAAGDDKEAQMNAAVEANVKYKDALSALGNLKEQAESQNRPATRIEKVLAEVRESQKRVVEIIM